MDGQRRKTRVALLSVVSNTTLILLKLVVGLLIGSVAVVSEAIHSGVDLVAAVVALFSVRTSSIPADEEHPFGHGKVENVSGTIEALLIFLAAGWIIFEAVKKLLSPEIVTEVGWGVAVMLVSFAVNILVSQRLFKVGTETDSVALLADAWHLRTDVYTSAGVMVGLLGIWLGNVVAPGADLRWIDPVAAILVALMILKAAYDLTVQAGRDLLDTRLPADEEMWIRHLISEHQPAVKGFHQLRTRKGGHFRFIDFHLQVDPALSVEESHRISETLSKGITARFAESSVTVHIEPCDGRCTDRCLTGCFLPGKAGRVT
jgi:cation diffusion facilitator family transporter